MVPEGTKGAINLFIELEKHKLNQTEGRSIRTSLQKRVAFPSRSKATASSTKKPDERKNDMRDKKQHTLYLQIVLMKQPGPAPQFKCNKVSNISQKNSYLHKHMANNLANNRDVNINRTADWFF